LSQNFLNFLRKGKPYFTCCIPGLSVVNKDFVLVPNYALTFTTALPGKHFPSWLAVAMKGSADSDFSSGLAIHLI
jgi:hypothetical protein